MKISTQGRYGLRLMLDLASWQAGRPVSLKQIAQRQEVSEKYLWQVVRQLKAAGLVHVTRGAKGGYTLARNPASITLRDIILPLEGPFALVDCTDDPAACARAEICAAREVWSSLSERIAALFGEVSLQDVLDRSAELGNQPLPGCYDI